MCGICGKLTYGQTPVHAAEIASMRRAISHRGPDDEGVYLNQTSDSEGRRVAVGLGHARLSIIDLSKAGHQPMCNEDGSVWIIYNGEIYNFQSLREDLKRKGHRFKSDSDTEVMLHLYEEEGIEAVRHLNGMFAFAVWDQRIPRLWLCRDRLGIKPLVYSWNGRELAFASEIKALLKLPELSDAIDFQALDLYLAFGYVPAPMTIYAGIQKLEPGHSLVLENGRVEKTRYWDVPHPAKSSAAGGLRTTGVVKDRIAEYKKNLFETLSDAVSLRMIADVPLGAFLSGGIDSSIVVALAARASDRPIRTFSIGFTDDAAYDETTYAREVARMYGTDHHEFKLSEQDMLAVLPDVLGSFDEPFADSSAIPTFIVSGHTRKHVTVALSGDGGDELFAGYRSYLGEYWRPTYEKIPAVIRRGAEKIVSGFSDSRDTKRMEFIRRVKKFMSATRGTYPERLLAIKSIIPAGVRAELLLTHQGNNNLCHADQALEWVGRLIKRYPGDRINTLLYTDLVDSLPGDMLTKVDWMSMQHALEVRVPFLDYRVVELAFRIPGDLKIFRGITKYILKETFRDVLPKRLMRRPKAGFEVPVSRWLKNGLRFLIDDYLSRDRIQSQGIFSYPVIARLKSDFFHNRTDTAWMLWNLIVFQHWHEHGRRSKNG